MSEVLANCPHCGTTFTVNVKQLSVANGHVRCGVCMDIFKVKDNSEKTKETRSLSPIKAKTKAKSSTSVKPIASPSSQNVHGPVSAPEGDMSMASLSVDDEISDAFDSLESTDGSDRLNFTRSIPEDDLPPYQVSNEKVERLDASIAVDSISKSQTVDSPANSNLSVNPDDAPSNKSSEVNLKEDSLEYEPTNGSLDGSLDDDLGYILEDDLFGHNDVPVIHVPLISNASSENKFSETSTKKPLLWFFCALVFSIFLAAQILVKNFDGLAIDEKYRSFYSLFCSSGLCQLPEQKNVTMVRASNLIVRPHPSYQNALIVDSIINNLAPFEQPFPQLLLSFSDTQGKIIASRRFLPEEYLGGELRLLNTMPIRSPLHVSLEILDPGENASSYKIDFIEASY